MLNEEELTKREELLTALVNVLGFSTLADLEDFVLLHGAAQVIPLRSLPPTTLDDSQSQSLLLSSNSANTTVITTAANERHQRRRFELASAKDRIERLCREVEFRKGELRKQEEQTGDREREVRLARADADDLRKQLEKVMQSRSFEVQDRQERSSASPTTPTQPTTTHDQPSNTYDQLQLHVAQLQQHILNLGQQQQQQRQQQQIHPFSTSSNPAAPHPALTSPNTSYAALNHRLTLSERENIRLKDRLLLANTKNASLELENDDLRSAARCVEQGEAEDVKCDHALSGRTNGEECGRISQDRSGLLGSNSLNRPTCRIPSPTAAAAKPHHNSSSNPPTLTRQLASIRGPSTRLHPPLNAVFYPSSLHVAPAPFPDLLATVVASSSVLPIIDAALDTAQLPMLPSVLPFATSTATHSRSAELARYADLWEEYSATIRRLGAITLWIEEHGLLWYSDHIHKGKKEEKKKERVPATSATSSSSIIPPPPTTQLDFPSFPTLDEILQPATASREATSLIVASSTASDNDDAVHSNYQAMRALVIRAKEELEAKKGWRVSLLKCLQKRKEKKVLQQELVSQVVMPNESTDAIEGLRKKGTSAIPSSLSSSSSSLKQKHRVAPAEDTATTIPLTVSRISSNETASTALPPPIPPAQSSQILIDPALLLATPRKKRKRTSLLFGDDHLLSSGTVSGSATGGVDRDVEERGKRRKNSSRNYTDHSISALATMQEAVPPASVFSKRTVVSVVQEPDTDDDESLPLAGEVKEGQFSPSRSPFKATGVNRSQSTRRPPLSPNPHLSLRLPSHLAFEAPPSAQLSKRILSSPLRSLRPPSAVASPSSTLARHRLTTFSAGNLQQECSPAATSSTIVPANVYHHLSQSEDDPDANKAAPSSASTSSIASRDSMLSSFESNSLVTKLRQRKSREKATKERLAKEEALRLREEEKRDRREMRKRAKDRAVEADDEEEEVEPRSSTNTGRSSREVKATDALVEDGGVDTGQKRKTRSKKEGGKEKGKARMASELDGGDSDQVNLDSSPPSRRQSGIDLRAMIREKRRTEMAQMKAAKQPVQRRIELNPNRNNGRTYHYSEVVRNQEERKLLVGHTCSGCDGYYKRQYAEEHGVEAAEAAAAANGGHFPGPSKMQDKIQKQSRHRAQYMLEPDPYKYWEMGFPSTAEVEDINEKAAQYHRDKRHMMEYEANLTNGVYCWAKD